MDNCTNMTRQLLCFEREDKHYCNSSVTCIPHLPSPNPLPSQTISHQDDDDRPGRPVYPSPPPPPPPSPSRSCSFSSNYRKPRPENPRPPLRPDDSLQCDGPKGIMYPQLAHPPRKSGPCKDARYPSGLAHRWCENALHDDDPDPRPDGPSREPGPKRRWCGNVLPDDDIHRLLICFSNPDPRPDQPSREPGPKRRWCHDTPQLLFTEHLPSFVVCA
ncbi:hypothetical protein BJV82DRAFT_579155 [Fennellomyces sp. T-0311]|nr:hypothetical protein BJV82DRAFT_579155 [Fennellomyces sp. T-0311]